MQNSTEQDLDKFSFLGEINREKLPVIVGCMNKHRWDYPTFLPNPYYQSPPWNVIKKSQLIESLIINIPISHILLFEEDKNICYVIDGQQRLDTIHEFFNNKFALQGLESWKNLEGLSYYQLPYEPKQRLGHRYIFIRKVIPDPNQQYSPEEYETLKKAAFTYPNINDIELGIKVPINNYET